MIYLLAYLALIGWLCAFAFFIELRDHKRAFTSQMEALRVINQAWRAVVDDVVTNKSRVVLRTDDQRVLVVALPVQHEIDYTEATKH